MAATAEANEAVSLHATLSPQRGTQAVTVGMDIGVAPSTPSSPPSELTIGYPIGLELELGELGLDTCAPARIEAVGPRGCPADSIMGYGSALAQVPVGSRLVHETARLALVRAPERDGHLALLVDAEGSEPLITRILLLGLLLPAKPPFGGVMQFTVPRVVSVPGGPDIALVRLDLTIGPPSLVYYEHRDGRTIAYHPKGIPLLGTCPADGLPFTATVRFLDGRRASTHTEVRCPLP